MSVPPAPTPPTPAEPTTQPYPRGDDSPAYRWAFTAWVVLFLLVVIAGLLNYLGIYLKSRG